MEAAQAQETEVTEEITEEIENFEANEEQELDSDNENSEGIEEEGEAEPEIEPWMSEDSEGETGDSEKPTKFLKVKKKLKGKISDQESEIEKLKRELESIKQTPTTQQIDPSSYGLKRPDELDFDSTDDYNRALDNYYINLANAERQKSDQLKQIEAKKVELEKGVEEHYSRAEKLIEKSGIAPEKYADADRKFREAVDKVATGKGDIIVDTLLATIGEGSEKVGYFIGNNEAARSKLQSLFIEDPSGLKAAAFLGAENQRLKGPIKKMSNAKPPAKNIEGDITAGSTAAKLKRQYDEAHKKGDIDKAWEIKKAARKAKIDVKGWAKG